MRARFIQFGMVLIGIFFAFPVGAVTEQTYDVSQATVQWTDNTHFTPQQYSFVNTQYLQTVTILMASSSVASSIIISTSTVNPNPKGIWHGLVTSTRDFNTYYATFFASSTQGDSAIHVDAGTQNRFVVPNNIGYYVSTNSSSYTNIYGWDQLGYSLNTFSLGSPTQNADLWVNFNGFSTGGSSIDWYARPTSTCDFRTWPTVENISSADRAQYGYQIAGVVNYGIASGQYYYLDYKDTALVNAAGCSPTSTDALSGLCSTNGGVRKQNPLLPGFTYYAKPYLVNDISTVIAQGYIDSVGISAQGQEWEFVIAGQPDANGCQAITAEYPSFTWPFVTSTILASPYSTDWCTAVSDGTTLGDVKAAFCSSMALLCGSIGNSCPNQAARPERKHSYASVG